MKGIIFARVSTKRQETEGLSLDKIQVPRMEEYVKDNQIDVVDRFVYQESADKKIRVKFNEMITYLKKHDDVKIVVCYRVDRITRNFRDAYAMDELLENYDKQIHFVEDHLILKKGSKGSEVMQWDMKVFVAKQTINQLKDHANDTRMTKLESGEWPFHAPLGYVNVSIEDSKDKWIDVDPRTSVIVKQIFDWYLTGTESLKSIIRKVAKEFDKKLSNGNMDKILSNKFYYGIMESDGVEYQHKYKTLISKSVFDRVQEIKHGYNKKSITVRKKGLKLYQGFMRCPSCGCMITVEPHKGHMYYRCTDAKDTHRINGEQLAYVREEEIDEQFTNLVKTLKIPIDKKQEVMECVREGSKGKMEHIENMRHYLNQQHSLISNRINNLRDDRLDRCITLEEYTDKNTELREKLKEIEDKLSMIEVVDESYYSTVERILDVCNRAEEIFKGSEVEEKRRFLNMILLNPTLSGRKLDYTLRKPFDSVFKCGKDTEWLPLVDTFRNREIDLQPTMFDAISKILSSCFPKTFSHVLV